MLKKSLVLGIAVLLTAVLFVFTGCEGPAGPIGQTGNNGSDVPFPGEITVTIPGSGVPNLPAGVTYPDGKGAKILAGNAADISKAFNGGVFVANTPDSGDLPGSTTGGVTYGQDSVDAVVWTGVVTTGEQGSIVVPPGKTLFIAAPLPMGNTGAVFQGITVADKATYFAQNPSASIQAAINGGTTVDENTPEGKVVILNGGSIVGDASSTEPITIGGYLEIHRGGFIDVNAATFSSTTGSTINNYGLIEGGTTRLTLNGELTIKGFGRVTGASATGYADIYNGKITVESYGTFVLGNPGVRTDFEGPVVVQKDADFYFETLTNANPVAFYNLVDMAGTLHTEDNSITTPAGRTPGHLKVASTGSIVANLWNHIRLGNDVSLLAAIEPNAQPAPVNNYITIEIPSDGLVTLTVGQIQATTYDNLRALAASTVLSLPDGITTDSGAPAFDRDDPVLEITTNDVVFEAYTTIGNVVVGAGKTLTIGSGIIDDAGNITVLGTLVPTAQPTFDTRLDSLTIGSDTVKVPANALAPALSLTAAEFNAATPTVITVNQGSRLSLGSGNLDVNPKGVIDLKDNAVLTIFGNTTTLRALDELSIAAGASLTYDDAATVTFESLEKLTVHGALDVTTVPYPFTKLHEVDRDIAGKTDVAGSGKAAFRGWAVLKTTPTTVNDRNHAFDQILAIKDVTVTSVTGISATSGTGLTDDASPPTGTDNILRVISAITAPSGGLMVDRDLNLLDTASINFDTTAGNTVAIKQGSHILAGTPTLTVPAQPGLSNGNPANNADPAVLVGGSSTTLTENAGVIEVGGADLTVQAGSFLSVDGTLTAGASGGGAIFAGADTAQITLDSSSLKSGLIKSGTLSGTKSLGNITVNGGGVLTLGGTDSEVLPEGSVTITAGGTIAADSSGTLSFFEVGAGYGLVIGDSDGILVAVNNSTITANASDGATIIGDLVGTKGVEVLHFAESGVGTEVLTITGSVLLRDGSYSYESVKIAGTTIVGEAVFDANSGTPAITLGGTLTGGTLTTKGNGNLAIGTLGDLKAISANGQALANITLDAADGLTAGSLTLGTGSILTLDGTFNVGEASPGGSACVLNVGTGLVKFEAGGAIQVITTSTGAAPSPVHQLKFGNFTFSALITSANETVYDGFPGGLTTGAVTANDIYIDDTGASSTVTGGTNGSVLTVSSGDVVITGAVNKTIDAASKVYLDT